MNRREFLMMLAGTGAAICAGCKALDGGGSTAHGSKVIDAGSPNAYAADGVYSNFREEGFFVIRKDGKLEALSSLCTHRNCLLDAEPDHSFYCKCHGSTFSPDGKVTKGPATENLPVLPIATTNGHLLVTVPT